MDVRGLLKMGTFFVNGERGPGVYHRVRPDHPVQPVVHTPNIMRGVSKTEVKHSEDLRRGQED